MKKEPTNKETILAELFKQKAEIQARIDKLLYPEPQVVIPTNFNLNSEIIKDIEQHPNGRSTLEVAKSLEIKYPTYGISRAKVSAAITYLTSIKKELERVDRGVYKKRSKENPVTT